MSDNDLPLIPETDLEPLGETPPDTLGSDTPVGIDDDATDESPAEAEQRIPGVNPASSAEAGANPA